jgi:hypothetical protein
MACPIIIRRHDGIQSYLVLDPKNPRELLRHWGFQDEFEIRSWLGSLDPVDAMEEWCEMLAEDPDNYSITDAENREYCLDRSCWDEIKK